MQTDLVRAVLTIADVKSEYNAWKNAKYRCFNPKSNSWKHYGGRGITMCPQWRNNFWKFYAHMGPKPSPRHSIDRYPDNDGHYEPGNVRWATSKQQSGNRRISPYAMTLERWARRREAHARRQKACRERMLARNFLHQPS